MLKLKFRKIIAINGHFDPLHIGHVRLFQEASKLGKLVVIVNNDTTTIEKKGYVFMPQEERAEIIRSIKGVSEVIIPSESSDNVLEVAGILKLIKADIMATGGDVTPDNTPLVETCKCLNIKILFNIGGGKIQSSSKLVKAIT